MGPSDVHSRRVVLSYRSVGHAVFVVLPKQHRPIVFRLPTLAIHLGSHDASRPGSSARLLALQQTFPTRLCRSPCPLSLTFCRNAHRPCFIQSLANWTFLIRSECAQVIQPAHCHGTARHGGSDSCESSRRSRRGFSSTTLAYSQSQSG